MNRDVWRLAVRARAWWGAKPNEMAPGVSREARGCAPCPTRWGAGAIKVWPSTPSEPCARRLFFGEDRRVAIRSSVVLCPVARLALRASAFLRRARRACAPSAHAPRPAPPQASDNHKHPQQPW